MKTRVGTVVLAEADAGSYVAPLIKEQSGAGWTIQPDYRRIEFKRAAEE